jgi:hypothetical protein
VQQPRQGPQQHRATGYFATSSSPHPDWRPWAAASHSSQRRSVHFYAFAAVDCGNTALQRRAPHGSTI